LGHLDFSSGPAFRDRRRFSAYPLCDTLWVKESDRPRSRPTRCLILNPGFGIFRMPPIVSVAGRPGRLPCQAKSGHCGPSPVSQVAFTPKVLVAPNHTAAGLACWAPSRGTNVARMAVDCRIRNSLRPYIRAAVLRRKSDITSQIRAAQGSEPSKIPERCAKPQEHEMVKDALLCLVFVSTGVIGVSLELGANYASAADGCITESNLFPPKGSRWYYHIDHPTNRKCWFLMKAMTAPVTSETQHKLSRLDLARTSPELGELSTARQTGQRGKHKLGEAEQAALFVEFLRWKEQQSAANSNAVELLRGPISP
jgi:hypothetical protein